MGFGGGDRILINDRKLNSDSKIEEITGNEIIEKYDNKFKVIPNNMAKYFAAEHADPLVFCHFADNIEDKTYDQVLSMSNLSTILKTH